MTAESIEPIGLQVKLDQIFVKFDVLNLVCNINQNPTVNDLTQENN